jgi:hypothetical protein
MLKTKILKKLDKPKIVGTPQNIRVSSHDSYPKTIGNL